MTPLYRRILIPFYRIKHKTEEAEKEDRPVLAFTIEARNQRSPTSTWGQLIFGDHRTWVDPVIANRSFRTLCKLFQDNPHMCYDLRLVRSGTPINTVII